VEYVVADRYGKEFDVEANGAVLRDAVGKPAGFIIALRDVSERKRMEQALRESEARYRELYEHMTSGVIVYEAVNGGEDFIGKDFNSAAERISKLRREDFAGSSVLETKPGIKKSGLFYVMQEVWRTGEPQYMPESHYEDESISGWRENFIYKLPSGEVVTVYNDITDRKRMEEALRESEMKFRTIFETIPDGVTVTDLKGRIIDQNQAGLRLGGYSGRGEVIGLSSLDYIEEADRSRAVADMAEVLETGSSSIKQYRLRRKDGGGKFDAEVIAAAIRGSFGSPTGLIVLTRDITERKRMEDALRESEEKLRIVFDAITDGIAVTDLQINVVQANEAVTRMAGYSSKDEVIGKNALQWIAPEDQFKAMGPMNEALKGRPIESGEFQIRNAQGREFLGDVGISPLRDKIGRAHV
jgi:PAS domain S-box-containing protein